MVCVNANKSAAKPLHFLPNQRKEGQQNLQNKGCSTTKPTQKKLRAKDRPLANDFVSDEAFDELLAGWFGNIARALDRDEPFIYGVDMLTVRTTHPS